MNWQGVVGDRGEGGGGGGGDAGTGGEGFLNVGVAEY